MKIKIREQSGTDASRGFDYQMAVAIDYLLSNIDCDAIVVLETIEDFAIYYNFHEQNEELEVYQVKTKGGGLYDKNALFEDRALGKIVLSDIYANSKAKTLNIICNANFKGKRTECLDKFYFCDKFDENELQRVKENVSEFLKSKNKEMPNLDTYVGKLVYIRSSLPFSSTESRYIETLTGKTNDVIYHCVGDDCDSINPRTILSALKLIFEKKRIHKFKTSEVDEDEAIDKKGIKTSDIKKLINDAKQRCGLTKREILNHAHRIFTPRECIDIESYYSEFVSCRCNLTDEVYPKALKTVRESYKTIASECSTTEDAVRRTTEKCLQILSYYPKPIVQLIVIVVAYDWSGEEI